MDVRTARHVGQQPSHGERQGMRDGRRVGTWPTGSSGTCQDAVETVSWVSAATKAHALFECVSAPVTKDANLWGEGRQRLICR